LTLPQTEIRPRGYLPYEGGGFTGGYALVDVDGDGSFELLILNPPSYTQVPVIKSIFTVRNGRLVCIDNGSSVLSYKTVLAADGTFYHIVRRGGGMPL
jgi:hypothetical protein